MSNDNLWGAACDGDDELRVSVAPISHEEANAARTLFLGDNDALRVRSDDALVRRACAVAWAIALHRHKRTALCEATVTTESSPPYAYAAKRTAGSGRQYANDRGGAIWRVLRILAERSVPDVFGDHGPDGVRWMHNVGIDKNEFALLVAVMQHNMQLDGGNAWQVVNAESIESIARSAVKNVACAPSRTENDHPRRPPVRFTRR